MPFKFFKSLSFIIISAFLFGADFYHLDYGLSAEAATNLKGRILLQVESRGEAWYLNPLNNLRYYLGRPTDAYNLIRSLGLGITNQNLAAFKVKAPQALAGRIFLQVESHGEAYYLSPLDLKLYYLGRPLDAFNLMRSQGLGISNQDLARLAIFQIPTTQGAGVIATSSYVAKFNFKYHNNPYEISHNFLTSLYEKYRNLPKLLTYKSDEEPANLREAFYGLFFISQPNDATLDEILFSLKAVAINNNWTDDELVEFTLALVQYIPYDAAKLTSTDNLNKNPYYPYETLYLNRGVCSDKTFLAVALLRKLGYGAAILDFPSINHSAVGLACPLEYSLNSSGYCYVETTNYFPLGVIPQTINSGQAQSATSSGFSNLFNSAILGEIEVYQKTNGKIYQGIPATKIRIANLQTIDDEINQRKITLSSLNTEARAQEAALKKLKEEMDNYLSSGQLTQYNNLVTSYNEQVIKYNSAVSNYQTQATNYNNLIAEYSLKIKEFYQK